jgi:hypothetical protein
MTKPATTSTPTKPVLVVFGLDQTGKPKAARFTGGQSEATREAAAAMQLTVFEVTGPDLEELARKLPVGRLHARGKAFIPYIRRDLYDRLQATCDKSASNGRNVAANEEPSQKKTQATEVLPIASGLPKNWDSLAPGHLVLIQESLADGWWECIVTGREDEILTLRFRDYPKVPSFQCHIRAVALTHPGHT